jgi:hypothetical protein
VRPREENQPGHAQPVIGALSVDADRTTGSLPDGDAPDDHSSADGRSTTAKSTLRNGLGRLALSIVPRNDGAEPEAAPFVRGEQAAEVPLSLMWR